MKTLKFTQPHNLAKICDELFNAFPEWRTPSRGFPAGFETTVIVSGDGTTLTLTVPDNTAEDELTAQVRSHDPTPVVVPDPLKTALDSADIDPGTTEAEKGFFHKLFDAVRGVVSPAAAQAGVDNPDGLK